MNPFLRLLRYATPHKTVMAGAAVAMVVYGASSAALAYLIKPIIDDVLPTGGNLASITAAILIVNLLKGIGSYFSSYLMEGLGHRVVMVVRNQLFRHLLDQSAAFFAQRTAGQLLSRINNDVGMVQRAVSETIGDLARESLTLLGCALLLFGFHWLFVWITSLIKLPDFKDMLDKIPETFRRCVTDRLPERTSTPGGRVSSDEPASTILEVDVEQFGLDGWGLEINPLLRFVLTERTRFDVLRVTRLVWIHERLAARKYHPLDVRHKDVLDRHA